MLHTSFCCITVSWSWELCLDHKSCVLIIRVVSWSWELCLDDENRVLIMRAVSWSWELCLDHESCVLIMRAVSWSWELCSGACIFILWTVFIDEHRHCCSCSLVLLINELWFLTITTTLLWHRCVQTQVECAKMLSTVRYHLSTPWTVWCYFVNTFRPLRAKPWEFTGSHFFQYIV